MKKEIWKLLALAGSFVVLVNSRRLLPYAGMKIPEEGYLVEGPESCRRILMEVVSGVERDQRKEIVVTGKDYEPETLVIARMFPNVVNISNTVLKEYEEGGHRYVMCRIGFEWNSMEVEEESEGIGNGEIEEGVPIGRHWSVGDRRTWTIGENDYVFQCIDDDYESNSEYQNCALFLCETVIRSDVDSTESKREILPFGETNNYKSSEVRTWLQENLADDEDYLVPVNIGVNSAYLGATVPGSYEDGSATGFLRHELEYQTVTDDLFLLSLEDAMEYRDVLWEIDGESTPYSHGYWLRTPVYGTEENGEFCYGNWIYVVDLEKGCIRPADVQDGSIGIRPAFCLPQM